MRKFIEEILKEDFKENYENIFQNSELLQYIDKKTNAITGNSKSRKNLGNIYAIYAFLYFKIKCCSTIHFTFNTIFKFMAF